MTQDEFFEKYGSVQVCFDSYHKYSFTYKASLDDGSMLTCSVGGNSDDIYRHEVSASKSESVVSLMPYCGSVYNGATLVGDFYDY